VTAAVVDASARIKRAAPPVAAAAPRNVAVDAYRGFVMFLMMAEVLRLGRVARAFPDNWLLGILAFNQTHVEWAGCSLHDLIQPSFSFLVGVALPYSLARRLSSGADSSRLFVHALWRSLLLVALGIFLRSTGSPITNFTFEDTLTQIGLGYPFLFLLGLRSTRVQWSALALLLVGYWLGWALYPLPAAGFDFASVGVSADWLQQHGYTGFAAHWNKNANFGNAFDQWFLNLFPRVKPFLFNGGGYLTLSFIPTLGTMILGLIAGQWLRDGGLRAAAPRIPYRQLLLAGAAGLAAGALLHVTGICPVVKRIWTPSWTLFSGGACFLLLAAFCWVIETRGYRRWAFPLLVIGANSIAAYLMAHLWEGFIVSSFRIHLGQTIFESFGPGVQPLLQGTAILLTFWLILFWMYRRKIFLRI
jgi:predicted acyltransferase